MSVARGFGLNGKSLYANVCKPETAFLNFTVDSTNGNGLGVRSIKSNGYVENVFMHTSATPGVGGNGLTNPNPSSGYALIQMKQNFNYFLGLQGGFVTPTATSTKIDNSALTVGQVYVITTLGNATPAQWVTLGVPAGVTPAVGVTFTALLVGLAGEANTSTSRVMLPTTSGISLIEVVGDTNTMFTSSIASNSGQWITIQFSKPSTTSSSYTPAGTITMNSYTPAGTITNGTPDTFAGTPAVLTGTFTGTPAAPVDSTTMVVAAPANNSVFGCQLWFDGSSVTIDGI